MFFISDFAFFQDQYVVGVIIAENDYLKKIESKTL